MASQVTSSFAPSNPDLWGADHFYMTSGSLDDAYAQRLRNDLGGKPSKLVDILNGKTVNFQGYEVNHATTKKVGIINKIETALKEGKIILCITESTQPISNKYYFQLTFAATSDKMGVVVHKQNYQNHPEDLTEIGKITVTYHLLKKNK